MSRPRPVRPRAAARLIATLSALVLGLLAVLATGAVPAQAHGGPIAIGLGTDGGGGIDAFLTYEGDGHPVEESAAITVVAVSDAGEEVGPLTLQSSSSGVGWYRSEAGVLGEGHWTVTATLTAPSEAEAQVEVDVVAPPTPEPAETSAQDGAQPGAEGGSGASDTSSDSDADAGAAEDTAVSDAAAETSGGGVTGWVIGAVVLVAAGAVLAVVLLRRRGAARP
ncbi:hypothetical protein [Litorihabitans aurantiacus]|uniref:Uncharacterized protein n=1 Tax=Litorihabitans aurantiacus TaxID=1930061 RepID=A0AA38CW10_9MICO|nr:hypothetical protein [Litorihabitans aurantiacus]GMA33220.1 hypothetical protein GCM10025875_32120 [Litorihabitans aurantiacus]